MLSKQEIDELVTPFCARQNCISLCLQDSDACGLRKIELQAISAISLQAENEELKQDIAQLRINKIADNSSEMYRINKIAELQAENDRLKETISSLTVAFDELNQTAKYHEGKVEKLLAENKALGKAYARHKAVLDEIKEYCEDNDTMGDQSPYYDGRGVVANRILAIISTKYSKSGVTGGNKDV